MFKLNPKGLLGVVAKGVYALASIGLVLEALILLVDGLKDIYLAIRDFATEFNYIIDGVSRIVIAVAIFEVGEYLLEEEVLQPRDQHSPAQARESLTKFLTILIIVTGIEAMMLVFKSVGKQDGSSLVYPALLIVAVAAALVGLGAYQRLSEPTVRKDQ